ncbi:chymotrypsin-like serine proteinase [Haliotis cracherodii]|uniref:chymotrypsin-like serine proteinase n=1 Tax=Haliotis cracherodii TaxID=6455 RepID=UPI0039ED693D
MTRTGGMTKVYIAAIMCLSAVCQASPQKRFGGGTDVSTNDFPWMGSLQTNVTGTWTHICGLVSGMGKSAAASAYHCFNTSSPLYDYRMVFDTNDLSDLSQATISNIEFALLTASFTTNGPGYSYDNIEYRSATPVTDASDPQIGTAIDQAGLECEILGWGKLTDGTFPSLLQKRNVKLISNAECQSRVSSLGATILSVDTCVDGNVISEGDDGSPLICNGAVVGVASWSAVGSCGKSVSVFIASGNFFVG